jgi:hypothetical protein
MYNKCFLRYNYFILNTFYPDTMYSVKLSSVISVSYCLIFPSNLTVSCQSCFLTLSAFSAAEIETRLEEVQSVAGRTEYSQGCLCILDAPGFSVWMLLREPTAVIAMRMELHLNFSYCFNVEILQIVFCTKGAGSSEPFRELELL